MTKNKKIIGIAIAAAAGIYFLYKKGYLKTIFPTGNTGKPPIGKVPPFVRILPSPPVSKQMIGK